MASYFLLILLLASTTAAATATATAVSCYGKSTTMRFFVHEFLSSTIRTVVPPLNNTNYFGWVAVIDDEIRSGPEATSVLMGRAQGFGVGTSMEIRTLQVSLDYVFTRGPYNGSTFQVFGEIPVMTPRPVELSVTGGTGHFRMARGYIITKTYSASRSTGTYIYGIDVVIYT